MTEIPRLKEKYNLAGCCNPRPETEIVGYFSHDDFLKVHAAGCDSLNKVEAERLISLDWNEIVAPIADVPVAEIGDLDELDFSVLKHHREYGIDYSLVLARELVIDKEIAFDRHKKLRGLGLIERVEARIVRYRKGIVDNKWIKHRNHTYYDLTDKGRQCLEYYESKVGKHDES